MRESFPGGRAPPISPPPPPARDRGHADRLGAGPLRGADVSAYEAARAELEGYERSGNKDRADQVRAELGGSPRPADPPPVVSVTDGPDRAADDPVAVEKAVPAKPKRARKA